MTLPPIEGRPVASYLFAKPQYNSAIFFENSQEQKSYIQRYCPTVKFSKNSFEEEAGPDANFIVVDIQETEPVPNVPYSELPFKEELIDNAYVARYNLTERSDRYDARSGIQQEHYDNILKPWIASRGIGPHVAVFDWDRTITVIEGLILSDDIIDDTLNYVCGGKTRVAMLKEMFQQLVLANIHIMILTNNSGGHTPKFNTLVRSLVGANKPAYSIVVSVDGPYYGIKAKAFERMEEFKKLGCASPPPPPVRFLPSGNENLYGELNTANKEVAGYFGTGGRKTRRHKRSRKMRRTMPRTMRRTMRRMMRGVMRRMLRNKRTRRCD